MLALLSTDLTGCNFSANVETMLSSPRLTQEQEQIYRALERAVGSSINLKYPNSGDRLSAFTVEDLDGDGSNEAIVFYETPKASAEENALRFYLLDQQENGNWRAVSNHSTAGAEVECVRIERLGNHSRTNLIIGYSMVDGAEHTAEVFHYENNSLVRTLSVPYTHMDVRDLSGDGNEELLLITAASHTTAAMASVYALDATGTYYQSQLALSNAYTEIAQVAYGSLPGLAAGMQAVYIDGLTGATTLQTEILTYCDHMLSLYYKDSVEQLSTARPAGLLTTDIDGDGELEIPIQTLFYGYSSNATGETPSVFMTNWYGCRNGVLMRKASSYCSVSDGFAFRLPQHWEKRVTVCIEQQELVFYALNNSEKTEDGFPDTGAALLRIAIEHDPVAASTMEEEGYLLLRRENGISYLAKIEAKTGSLAISRSDLLFAFTYFT